MFHFENWHFSSSSLFFLSSLPQLLPFATCCWSVPAVLSTLLAYRSGHHPTGLFVCGLQFIIALVQRSSVILEMCAAQFHFNDAIRFMISAILVCINIKQWFGICYYFYLFHTLNIGKFTTVILSKSSIRQFKYILWFEGTLFNHGHEKRETLLKNDVFFCI